MISFIIIDNLFVKLLGFHFKVNDQKLISSNEEPY